MSSARVAVLVKRFPRLSESFVLGEILELRRQGVDLTVYALGDPRERVVDPAAAALVPEVRYLHGRRRPLSWPRLLTGALLAAAAHPRGALRVLREVVAVHRCSPATLRHAVEGMWLAGDLRRRRITRLHAHFAHSPAAVAHLCRLAGGPPFGITAHAKDLYTTPPDRLRRRLRAADVVITCTHANAHHVHDSVDPSVRVAVVHHGVDVRRFTPAPSPDGGAVLLTVGRLVAKKGHDDLLTAVAQLRDAGVDVCWEVVGEGPLRRRIEDRVRELGLQDCVALRGALPPASVLAAYRRARIFALAPVLLEDGDRDGIPNVLVEAMACGLPVVSTRMSGIPELIEDGTDGLLVAPHRPEALAAAVESLLGDPALAGRLGAAARRTVERRFDVRRNTRAVAELLGGGPGPVLEQEWTAA